MKSLTYILVKPERKKKPKLIHRSEIDIFPGSVPVSYRQQPLRPHLSGACALPLWASCLACGSNCSCPDRGLWACFLPVYTDNNLAFPKKQQVLINQTKIIHDAVGFFFFKTLSYLFIDFDYKVTIIRFRGKEANDNELPIKFFALRAGGMIHAFKSIKWVIYMYICTIGTLSWIDWIFCIYWLLI